MANRYWVGGTGTWNTTSTTNWSATPGGTSGASVPTATDAVFFDQAGTYTVTMTGSIACLDFTVSAGVVTFAQGTSPAIAISGSMSLLAGTVWSATGPITFIATTTGKTITTNGTTISSPISLNGIGGGWSLGSALTIGATQTTSLISGALSLNGFNLTTGVFSSSGGSTRSIDFGANNIVLAHTTAGQTVLAMATVAGFTWTGTGGFTGDASVTRTYTFGTTGGSRLISPNLTLTGSGTAVATFTTGSWFNTLNFGTTAFNPGTTNLNLNSLTLSSGGTFTSLTATMVDTGTITSNGNTTLGALTINSTTGITTLAAAFTLSATSTTTLTSGTLALADFTLTTGIFSSNNTNTRSITFGAGNIALTHTTATTTVLSMATATGFTWTGTGGFTTTAAVTRTVVFGTTGGSTTNSPNLTLTGSGTSVITFTTASWFNTLNFGTTAFNPGTTNLNLNSLTLSSGGTFTGLTATMVGTGTITSNGNTTLAALTINSTTGITTLAAAFTLTATGTTTLTSGTLALANFTLTTGIFSSSGAVTRAISFGSGNIVLAHTTALTTVLSMATVTGFTWTGTGGFTTTAATTRTVVFGTTGGTTTNAPNLSLTGSGASVITFTTASWFNTLDFGTTAFNPGTTALSLNSLLLSTGGTFTGLTATMVGTGTINARTNTTLGVLTINTTAGTTTLGAALTLNTNATTTLSSGTLDLGGFNLTTGIFSSNNATARAITFGTNNIVLNHATAATTVLAMPVVTNFTNTGTGGFTTDASITRTVTFGTTGGTTANAPNLSLTGSGTAVVTLTTASWFNTLNFGTTAFNPGTTNLNLNSLTLSSGGTFTTLTATMRGTGTITPNSNATLGPLVINNGAGTTTLASALSCTTYTQTAGTIDFATFNLTCSSTASYTAGTLSNIGTISCTTWTVAATATFTLTQGAITPSTSFVVAAATSTFNYNGGTLTTPLFTQTAGTVTLGASLNIGVTSTYTLTAGTLNLNGFDLTTGIFSSSNSNTRAISFGSNNIILAHTTLATTVLAMGTVTGFTNTGTGGFTTDASITRTVTFGTTGGTATNSCNFRLTGSGTSVITFTTASWFDILDFGTTAFTIGTTTLNLTSLTLSSGGTFTTLTASMRATGVVEGNGNTTLGALTINSTGTTTFSSALTMAATGTVTLTSGTLDLSGFDLTTGIFSSSGSTARTVAFGSNNIILAHTTAATTVLAMATVTAFTWTGTGGFVSGMSVTRTFTFGTTGGSTTTAPNLYINSGASVPTFTDGSWFEILDFTGSSCAPAMSASVLGIYVDTLTLATGGTFTGLIPVFTRTQTWTAQFSKQLGGIGVNNPGGTLTLDATQTYTATSSTILTAGTLDLGGVDLTTGIFSSSNANTRSIAFGSNKIILAHTTAATTVLVMANATGFTYTGTGLFTTDASITRTLTFGTTAGSVSNAPNLSLTGSGTAVITLTTASWFNDLDFGTTAFTIGTTTLNINGNLTLSTGGTFTSLSPTMVGTGNINNNGKAIAGLTVNNGAGTTSLTAALSCTTFTMTAGTIDFNFFNLTCSAGATYTAGTMLNFPTVNCTTWTVNGTFTMTSGTITPSVSFVITSGAFNYNGGTLSAVPTFTHTAGTVTLGQTYALTATGTYTLTAGTLNLNGFNLTTGIFSSSNTNARSIAFGTNNIILAHTTGATTVLAMGTTTGFTNTGTGGFVTDASITRTVTFGTTGGSATNSPNLSLTGSGVSVITFTTGSWFDILDFGTTAFTIGTTTLNLNGFMLSSTGTFTTLTANMVGTGTIVNNGNNTLGVLTINNTAGTTTLGDAFTTGPIAVTTLTSGTLNLNGFTFTTGTFSSNNANTRGITFGSSNIVIGSVLSGATAIDMANATGFTWTGTGAFTTNASVTRTYTFGTTGGSAVNAPNLLITSGASIPTFTDGSWFNTLDFTGTTCTPAVTASAIGTYVSTLTLATGGTYTALIPVFTRTQTWTAQFSKQLGGMGVNGSGVTLTLDGTQTFTATSPFFLVAGTLDLGGADLSVGVFIANNTNTRSIAFGTNNITITTTTAAQTVLNIPNATGFTYTGTGGFISDASVTRTFNFGATSAGTSATAPNLAFTGSGTAVQTFQSGGKFGILDFGTTAFNPGTTALSLNGLSLSSGGTFSTFSATMFGSGTITSNGNTTLLSLNINAPGGTTSLGDAFTVLTNSTVTITNGTLNLNGNDLTTGIFASSGTGARSIAFGSNNIVLAHTTAATTVLSFATATGFTRSGTGGFVTDASITRTVVFGTTGGSATNSPNLTLTGSGTAVITFTTASWFNNLSFGTTAFTIGTTALSLGGLSLSSGGTFTALTPTMVGTGTITSNGNTTLGTLIINTTSGTTTLNGSLSLNTNATATLTSGTLDLSGFNLTTGIFSSNNTTARAISFGSGDIVLAHTTAATTVLAMQVATNFTNTGTGGFVTDASITRTLTFGTTGGSTTNSPNLTLTGSGTSVITLTNNSWYNKLDFGTTAFTIGTTTLNLNSLTLSSGGTFTTLTAAMRGDGTLNSNGNVTLATLTINNTGTTTLGAAFVLSATGTTTLTAGTLDLNGFNLTTGIFSSTNSNTRAISFGSNNIILAHTTAATSVLFMGNSNNFSWTGTGGFVSDASITRTYTFGTGGSSFDISPNLTLTGSGTAIQTFSTGSWFNTLDFGTTAFTIGTTTLNLNNVLLSSGGTFTALTATMVGTGSITPNGNTTLGPVVINNGAGTTSLPAALNCTTFSMTAGTMDFNFFNLTCSSTFTYVSGTMLDLPTITCTTYTVNGTFTMTSGTITPSVSFVLQSGAFNYNGGTLSAVPTFTHTAGTFTLGQAYALTATGAYTLTAGTLNLNGFDLTTGAFSSSNANARAITFGSNNIILAHTTAATTVLGMATATGFTNTGTGGFVTDASITRTVVFGTTGGTTTNAPNLTLTGSGTAVITFTTASWFNTLDFGTTAFTIGTTTLNLNSFTLSSGGTFTALTASMVGTGTTTTQGKQIAAFTVNNVSGTTTLGDALSTAVTGTTTLTSGTLDLNGFTLNTGIFSSSGALTREIIFGSANIYLTHTTAATTVLAMANTTGLTSTATSSGGFISSTSVTKTFTVGTTGGSPSAAPNLLITSTASGNPTFTDGSWFKILEFTGSAAPAQTAYVLGVQVDTLILSITGVYGSLVPVFTRTQTWTRQYSKDFYGIGVNGSGVTLTLDGTQTFNGTTGPLIVTAGTLDLGGYDISVGAFLSNNTNTRSVAFGSNKIILVHPTAATNVLNIANMTGFTATGTGGFSTNMTVTRTFTVGTTAGGNSAGAPSLFLTGSGTSLPTLTTSWFNVFDLSGLTSFGAFQFINGTALNINSYVGNSNALLTSQYLNLTFVGTGSISGTSAGAWSIPTITINHNGTTTLNSSVYMAYPGVAQSGGQTPGTFTLTSGTLNLNTYSVVGIAVFSSSNSNTRAIAGTGSISLNAASTVGSTALNMANATNFSTSGSWYFTCTGSKTLVFGTTGGSSTNAPNLKITSTLTSTTLTSGSWFNTLDFTGTTTGTLATTALNLNSLTLPSGGSAVFTGLSTNMVGTGTITPNGKSIASMTINNGSDTTTLAGDLTTNTSTTLTAGNLALAGFTLTPTQFISDGAATRTISGGGTGVISVANDWTVSNGTGFSGTDYTINMTKSTAKTFAGAGGTYGTLVQAGAGDLTISGSNNLYDLQATTTPSTITFTAGTTQYFSLFSLVGTAGNLVTINSTVPGTQYNLWKSGALVNVSYLSIQDSNVGGGSSWYNNNGTNTILSNNTGWNQSIGQFMAFF